MWPESPQLTVLPLMQKVRFIGENLGREFQSKMCVQTTPKIPHASTVEETGRMKGIPKGKKLPE